MGNFLKKVPQDPSKTFPAGKMGVAVVEHERIRKNERENECASHFEAVSPDGRGRANATSPKRKRAFFVGAYALR